jgi:uncharacterized membrane protein
MNKISFFVGLLCVLFLPSITSANTLEDKQGITKAVVVSIDGTQKRFSELSQKEELVQILSAEIISGREKGKVVSIENDYIELSQGKKFFIQKHIDETTQVEVYSVSEPNRLPSIIFFTVLFLVILFTFGGIQGVRGLISLIISLVLIIFVLIPSMLKGYSPILVSLIVSSVIIVLGSYITHGFNRTTTAAVMGMIGAVGITGILSFIAVHSTYLSGFSSDESIYLQSATQGLFNVQGLLLSGILIGLLGVLYDAAISQAVAIEELLRANKTMSIKELYKRGIRIGREHIGALVDTLAIAYVGASLPLLLLVVHSGGSGSLAYTINREIFATEIIRTLVGSIGLILAVPLTTYISVLVLKNSKNLGQRESTHHHH